MAPRTSAAASATFTGFEPCNPLCASQWSTVTVTGCAPADDESSDQSAALGVQSQVKPAALATMLSTVAPPATSLTWNRSPVCAVPSHCTSGLATDCGISAPSSG